MCLGGYTEVLQVVYMRIVCTWRNRVDLSCVLLIFSLSHMLFSSNGIPEVATFTQKLFIKVKKKPQLGKRALRCTKLVYTGDQDRLEADEQEQLSSLVLVLRADATAEDEIDPGYQQILRKRI